MSPDDSPILCLRGVTFGYRRNPIFLGPVNLAAKTAQIHAIVGPNGAGKSTLLRLAVGLLPPNGGAIELAGRPLTAAAPRERARRIAFLPQKPLTPAGMSAEEIVRLGRHPHRSWRLFENPGDLRQVSHALNRTETAALADRDMATLSGGEAQRVHLAAALAQQPDVLALDEPTGGLDLYHQLRIFDLLRKLATGGGLTVLVVTHELNLAARYADEVTLLHDGQVVAQGAPAQVLSPNILGDVYRVQFAEFEDAGGDRWLFARAATGLGQGDLP